MYGPLYSLPAFFLLLPLASRLFCALSVRHVNMYAHQTAYPAYFLFFLLCTTTVSPYHLQGMLRFIEHTIPDQSFTFCLFVLTSSLFLLLVYIVQVLFVLSSLYLLLFPLFVVP